MTVVEPIPGQTPVGESAWLMSSGGVRFIVYGDPKPQGSKSAFPVQRGGKTIAVVKESGSKAHARWRNDVADAARQVANLDEVDAPFGGPLLLQVRFRFRMPGSRPAAARKAGTILRTVAPDLSKLVRAVEDSLQGACLIRDDATIAQLQALKVEVTEGWTGAEITVRRLTK